MKAKNIICIFLVRHGQTDWNVKGRIQGSLGVPLNKKGIAQAKELAKKFKKMEITHVYSSHIRRAKQTAGIIAKPNKLNVRHNKDLRERSYGVLEGYMIEDFRKKHPSINLREVGIDWKAPRGESIRQTMDRVLNAFKKIVGKHKLGDRVVIVSHGSSLLGLVHRLKGRAPERVWSSKPLENAEIIEVHMHAKKAKVIKSHKKSGS